jgi:multicomponent Na+:H+ antiporter subunit C
MTAFPVSTVMMATGFGLILIGLAGLLLHRNILRMIIGFSLVDSGIAIVLVSMGYVTGGTAPIIDADLPLDEAVARVVDPVPSALTVTAIVIGMSVTAVLLAYAIRLYRTHGTLDIGAFRDSRG